jgi:hypothetical protein
MANGAWQTFDNKVCPQILSIRSRKQPGAAEEHILWAATAKGLQLPLDFTCGDSHPSTRVGPSELAASPLLHGLCLHVIAAPQPHARFDGTLEEQTLALPEQYETPSTPFPEMVRWIPHESGHP